MKCALESDIPFERMQVPDPELKDSPYLLHGLRLVRADPRVRRGVRSTTRALLTLETELAPVNLESESKSILLLPWVSYGIRGTLACVLDRGTGVVRSFTSRRSFATVKDEFRATKQLPDFHDKDFLPSGARNPWSPSSVCPDVSDLSFFSRAGRNAIRIYLKDSSAWFTEASTGRAARNSRLNRFTNAIWEAQSTLTDTAVSRWLSSMHPRALQLLKDNKLMSLENLSYCLPADSNRQVYRAQFLSCFPLLQWAKEDSELKSAVDQGLSPLPAAQRLLNAGAPLSRRICRLPSDRLAVLVRRALPQSWHPERLGQDEASRATTTALCCLHPEHIPTYSPGTAQSQAFTNCFQYAFLMAGTLVHRDIGRDRASPDLLSLDVIANTAGALMRQAKGRWEETDKRWAPLLANHNNRWQITDYVSLIGRALILPAIIENLDAPVLGADLPQGQGLRHRLHGPSLAFRTLLDYTSLSKLQRLNKQWHRYRYWYNPSGSLQWTALFDKVTAPNGIEIIPLTTSGDLAEEGRVMHHCVASFNYNCAYGNSEICSLRAPEGERLSTLELKVDCLGRKIAVRVAQNMTFHDRRADERAHAAADWLISALNNGEIPFSQERARACRNNQLLEDDRHSVRIDPQEAFSVLRGDLPPALRTSTFAEFSEKIGARERARELLAED